MSARARDTERISRVQNFVAYATKFCTGGFRRASMFLYQYLRKSSHTCDDFSGARTFLFAASRDEIEPPNSPKPQSARRLLRTGMSALRFGCGTSHAALYRRFVIFVIGSRPKVP